jgi:hypothetical protein
MIAALNEPVGVDPSTGKFFSQAPKAGYASLHHFDI